MDDLEDYRKHRKDCEFKFAPLDVCLCTEKNMLDRIEALEARMAARAEKALVEDSIAEVRPVPRFYREGSDT